MTTPPELDGSDREILRLLQEDGRRTMADIAERIAMSPTAVKRRVARLERLGVITGYSATVDYAKLGEGLEAFIEVRFRGRTSPEDMDRTASGLTAARAVFTLAGDQDAFIWVRVRDVDHLKDVIADLRQYPNVLGTSTHIVLFSHVKR